MSLDIFWTTKERKDGRFVKTINVSRVYDFLISQEC